MHGTVFCCWNLLPWSSFAVAPARFIPQGTRSTCFPFLRSLLSTYPATACPDWPLYREIRAASHPGRLATRQTSQQAPWSSIHNLNILLQRQGLRGIPGIDDHIHSSLSALTLEIGATSRRSLISPEKTDPGRLAIAKLAHRVTVDTFTPSETRPQSSI